MKHDDMKKDLNKGAISAGLKTFSVKPHDSMYFKARLTLKFRAQDALALIVKQEESVIAKYGF